LSKQLADLLAKISFHPDLSKDAKEQIIKASQISFNGVTCHTGKVKADDAFFCVVGEKFDGNDFAADAVNKGAVCVFTERLDLQLPVPVIPVVSVRQSLAIASNFIFDCPSQHLRVLGLTGTNGKTTTTHLIEYVLNKLGKRAGLIGTLGARWPISNGEVYHEKFGQTTPQAPDFQSMLARMVESGLTHVVMEVSSHALALGHVAGTNFASACLTNVTQDHLDFHKSMEHYWHSKRKLFEQLAESSQENKSAIANADDVLASSFLAVITPESKKYTFSYNTKSGASLNLLKAEYGFDYSLLTFAGPEGEFTVRLKLTGPFNTYNVMAAILVCYAEGLPLTDIVTTLESFEGVPGRFEIVRSNNGASKKEPLCIVDYAHTPDGLENVLNAARAILPKEGKLVVVFGCGGDRDSSKRPKMGEIAHRLADRIIITSDNPRSEEPQKIIADILAGVSRLSEVQVEADRNKAIKSAVLQAKVDDVIVIAGKGHETYQIMGAITIDFDDRVHAREALLER
jgi:UDP-N-acetylmuramoyl-L-alanyl-D-glutamate--2,6-diaminopimelate ligase